MKKIYIYLLLLASAATSCSDWLDVNPRTQMDQDKLFKSEAGFKSAHTGAYMLMTQSSLYGKDANMFLPEALSRSWYANRNTSANSDLTALYELTNMRYTDDANAERIVERVWAQYYTVIAQLNNVLENLEKSNITFTFKNDQLIRGEILGLRAFLHLEVLRFFGSVPGEGNVGVPYLEQMTKNVDALSSKSYSEVVALIKRDLDEAEKILQDVDMIVNYTNRELDKKSELDKHDIVYDEWQTQRQGRFNYYAVLATKARLYNWIGEKDEAVKYAKMVVDAKNKDDKSKFLLVTKSTFEDHILYAENIFTLHYPKLVTNLKPTFETSSAMLYQTKDNVEKVFGVASSTNDDLRAELNRYWKEITYDAGATKINHFYKYIGNEENPSKNRMPLIKVSELYLTIAEYAELSVSTEYFKTFAISRGLPPDERDDAMSDETKKKNILEREWRREFFGEGQMFFYYKRHNYANYTWPDAFVVPKGAYVIPKPKGQINFE